MTFDSHTKPEYSSAADCSFDWAMRMGLPVA
jgi:hypothetical protein